MFFAVSILLLSLFDIVSTHYYIVLYGTTAVEANPIMRWVMEAYGMQAAYIFRMIMPLLGLALIFWVRNKDYNLGQWSLRISFWAHGALGMYHLYLTEFFTIHIG